MLLLSLLPLEIEGGCKSTVTVDTKERTDNNGNTFLLDFSRINGTIFLMF